MNTQTALSLSPAYGTWKVTTEGDCEGRSTRDLGTHTGYLDEIAFALAKDVYYSLRFVAVNPLALAKANPTGTKVQVSLDIATGTWDLDQKERIQYFEKMLAGWDTVVRAGTYHACVELVSGLSPEAQAEAARRLLVQSALSKLTPDEIEALKAAK
jgi:hypothetical protein